MLLLKNIQQNKAEIIERLKVKNFDASKSIQKVLDKDTERRHNQKTLDAILAELNALSRLIGQLLKSGNKEDANAAKAKTIELKEKSKLLSQRANDINKELRDILVEIPNPPHHSVPVGKGEVDNVEVKSGGVLPHLQEEALAHWDLAKKYGIIDFELGNKITGAGFPVYAGKGAKLQRSLINYFLDRAEMAGYHEVLPPILVNEDSGFGTGQLPDKEGQMYHCQVDNFYLVPTAEVPITNIFRDVIINEKDLPIQYAGYTPCFRREAGSYGKEVRGLNRLHQFDKVEIVNVAHPKNSYKVLDSMVSHVESLVKDLELPYRILKLCGGDISFTSALTYDFEVYSAAQKKWLEVSSVSNFEAFQANRMKLRIKDEAGIYLAHTLNGSALALPRIVAAILENNQTPDGIRIPEVLHKYTGFKTI